MDQFDKDGELMETDSDSKDTDKKEDEYEQFCFLCRRSESQA